MASPLQRIGKEVKQAIFNDYISGMDVKTIQKKYGFKHLRTCYYHLPPLTREFKMLHMLNKAKQLKEDLKNEDNISV